MQEVSRDSTVAKGRHHETRISIGGPLIPIALLLAGCAAPGAELEAVEAVGARGFSTTSVFSGDYDFSGPSSRPLSPGQYDVLPLEIVDLVADVDGKPIEFGLVPPDVPEGTRVPVLLVATPYQHGFRDQPLSAGAKGVDDAWLDRVFVPYGYALAILPMRGTGNTGGCSDMNGPLDAAILDQVLSWLGTQAWSNGNIGMYGLSSPGSTPWVAAGTGNPYLKTIVPIAGINDQFRYNVYNGSFPIGKVGPAGPALHPIFYYGLYGTISYSPASGRNPQNTVDGIICPETLAGIATASASAWTRERDVSGYYERRNMRDEVEANYQGSVFIVHGFTDLNVMPHHVYPWVRTLEDREIVVKHLLGQWNHTYPDVAGDPENPRGMRWDFQESLLHWFDYWLKEDKSVDLGPVAEVQDSAGRWRAEASWPPRDAREPAGAIA